MGIPFRGAIVDHEAGYRDGDGDHTPSRFVDYGEVTKYLFTLGLDRSSTPLDRDGGRKQDRDQKMTWK